MKTTVEVINDALDVIQDFPERHPLNAIAAAHLYEQAIDERDTNKKATLFIDYLKVASAPMPMGQCQYDHCGEWFPTADLERVGDGRSFCRECAMEERADIAEARHDFARRFFGRS